MDGFVQESIAKIKDAIDRNKLVVFAGAGVSANSGMPLWKDIIDKFARSVGGVQENYSSEEYLKIPQYYFNERGFKEYFDVVTSAFNVDAKSNPIHEAIFDLNPAHVITTNYDDLLEQAALRKGMFYDSVKQDTDLPYTPNNKMIIKMHGDLKIKNIVLKEDDYLSYSNNFRLIENFIKSLFATYTVLFVGYSVNDPDVKLIFQWVKDILKQDFQHAYLINTSREKKEINRIEFEYYRKRGINILYYSAIQDIADDVHIENEKLNILDSKGIALYKFLKTICCTPVMKGMTATDIMYDRMIVLDVLKRILPKDIKRVIDEDCYINQENTIISNSEIMKNFINEMVTLDEKGKTNNLTLEELKQLEKIKLIERIFEKANIPSIQVNSNEKPFVFNKIEKSINTRDGVIFDYIEVKSKLDKMVLDAKETEDFLIEKAYCFYVIGDYLNAYKSLKKASKLAFRNKKYLIFFLSEFNRLNVGKVIGNVLFSKKHIPDDERNKVKREIKSIDLDEIFSKMPLHERKKHAFLKDLLNFKLIYEFIHKATGLQSKIRDDVKTIRAPLSGPIYKLDSLVTNLWEYLNLNHLLVEHFSELKSFYSIYIESVLISYTTPEYTSKENTFIGYGKNDKLQALTYFMLFVMSNYIKTKDLEEILYKYEVKRLFVTDGDKERFLSAFQNLNKSLNELDMPFDFRQKINNTFILLSKIQIGHAGFVQVVESFSELITSNIAIQRNYEYFGDFVIGQCNQYKDDVDAESLLYFCKVYLTKFIDGKWTGGDYEGTNTEDVIERVTDAIKLMGPQYIVSDLLIISLMESVRNLEDVDQTNLIKKILIPLSGIADENGRRNINDFISNLLNRDFDLLLYYEACVNKVIEPNFSQEEMFLKEVERVISENEELKKQGKREFPNKTDVYMGYLTDLLYSGVALNLENYRRFLGIRELYDFVFDMENYNYSKFDVDWLLTLPDSWVDKILIHSSARPIINDKIRVLILEGKAKTRLIELYFKYY